MSHPDARLTRQSRPGLVREAGGGWTRAGAARRFRVSRATAAKWVRRYRTRAGPACPTAARAGAARRGRDCWVNRASGWDTEPPVAVLRHATAAARPLPADNVPGNYT